MKKIMCILFVLSLIFTAQANVVNGDFSGNPTTNATVATSQLSGNPISIVLNKGWYTNSSSTMAIISGGVLTRQTGGAAQLSGSEQFFTDSQLGALKLKYDLQVIDTNAGDSVYIQLYGYKYLQPLGSGIGSAVMGSADPARIIINSSATPGTGSTNWTVTALVDYKYSSGTLNGGNWATQTNDFSDTDVTNGEYDIYGLRIIANSGAGDVINVDNVMITDPYHFLLTVNFGIGDGSYTNQQQVLISADAPVNGKIFDQWDGDTQYVASVTSSPTTVTMPNNAVTLTAKYTDAPYYTLTVNYGTAGSASNSAGQVVSIIASNAPSGQTFDKWTGDTQYVASVTSPTTTVNMPAQPVTVTATYKNAYTLTVNYGNGSGSYDSNQVVNITASNAPSGQVFDQWTGDIQYVANVGASNTTVTMPATNISVTATYLNLPVTGNWLGPAGDWSVSGNWLSNAVPNAARDIANIKAEITSDQTVVLDTAVTLGALAIGPVSTSAGGAYTLAGPNTLTFNNGAKGATLTDTAGKSGSTTISADVLLQNNLAVAVQAVSNALVLSGNVSGSGASLTKLNPGWLKLFGTNSYSGGTIASSGKLAINSDRSLGAVPASPQVNLVTSNRWTWLMVFDDVTLNANRNIRLTEKAGIAAKEGKTLTINGQISGVGPTLNPNFGPDSVYPEDPEATVWHGNFVFAPGNTYTNDTTADIKTVLCYGRLYISADSCLGAVPDSFYYRDVILADGNYGNPTYAAILSATETFALNANRGVSLQSPKNAIEVAAGKTFTIQGPVVAETSKPMAGLNKLGTGTLVLNGLNTYTGNTTVVAGRLLVNNSLPAGAISTVSVSNGATLGGTGTINNPVTVDGLLAPGASAGTLTVAANVTLASSAVLSVDVGASSDQLNLATVGGISLAGNLSVIDTGTITTGTVITIVNNATSVTGEFNSLTNGATLVTANNRYKINYGATAITLTVVQDAAVAVLGVSPASYDFGAVKVGNYTSCVFTVTNSGTAALAGTATVSSAYSVTAGSPFSVPAGGSAGVTVRFTPVAGITYNGVNVSFQSNGGSVDRPVSGSGYIVSGSTNTLVGVVNGNYTFNIGIVSGVVYHVEASTNLLNHPNGWTNISGSLVSTNSKVTFADTNTASFPVRMYRVLSP